MQIPDWWLTASGLFFILGSIAMVVFTVLVAVAIWVMLDLKDKANQINGKVSSIGEKVEDITQTVSSVTSDLGARAKGIAHLVDEHTSTAMNVIERLGPPVLAVALMMKLYRENKAAEPRLEE